MDNHFLAKTLLFRGIAAEEIPTMLQCLEVKQRQFLKGEIIYYAGDIIQSMGLVLSGSVHIESDDVWGNKSLLDRVAPGSVFAETYASIPGEPLMVNVVAAECSQILFLDVGRILQTCSSSCAFHNKLIRNLLSISAQKNLKLSRRIFHTTSKTIRGRIVSYLSFQVVQQGSYIFSIPLNRQQLADYLGVDRSALSNEISKMQKEGLLQVHRNTFHLKKGNFHEWEK